MNLDYIRTIITYNYATHRRLWDSIMHLTDEQFIQPVEYSIGSIRNHMVHLASVDSRWLARMTEIPQPARLIPDDFPTRDLARQKWDEVEANMLAAVAALTEDDLQRSIHYEMVRMDGSRVHATNTLWQMLAHVVNHGTDHRAQVLPILYRMGAPTFEQDLIIHLWHQVPEPEE